MTVREIIEEYLKANGYDGLAGDECGCELGDLMPCNGDFEGVADCVPGHKEPCNPETCEMGGGCEWHIRTGEKDEH